MSAVRGFLVLLGLGAAAAAAALYAAQPVSVPAKLSYPPAERGTVSDDYHGTRVPDPYRWLEDLDSGATRAWVSAQAKLTEQYLAALPQRQALRTRIAQLYEYERSGVPFSAGGRYFVTHNDGHQEQNVLMMSEGLDGTPGVLLDPNALKDAGNPVVRDYAVNRAGTLLAYAVSLSGSDWTEWRIRDVTTRQDLPEVLRHTKYYAPVFTPDGKGVYYSAFPPPRAGAELSTQDLGNAVYYHALGTPLAADQRVLGDPAHPDWQYEPYLSEDGRWLIVLCGEGEVGDKGRENVYLFDTTAATPQAQLIADGFEAGYSFVGADRGRLYFLTSLAAPNGRVVAIDPRQSAREHWQNVVPEGRDAISFTERAVTLVDHQLIVRTVHDAHTRVLSYALDGAPGREISLPRPGAASGFEGHAADQETFYRFTDLVTAPTIYRYDTKSGESRVVHAPRVAFDPAEFEERQVFYPAKDGTRIPLLLAYRRGLKLQGNNPLLLYGYGGFGISVLPEFRPARIAWLEMGGVFAIANIRGGGEYGESWHRQAIRTHRQVAFDDFIAAAEWLIAERYTSTPHLAIQGGSNGGLLAGACLTQRPGLYGAVIAQVGVLDMLRFNLFGQGAGWEGDYGSPQNPEEFKALYAYSPVHNVRPGTRYPATLIVTGDHDTRVMPMHSFKFAAALQAAQAGPAPVLLAVDIASGHSGSETVTQAIAQTADSYAFLARNLGMRTR